MVDRFRDVNAGRGGVAEMQPFEDDEGTRREWGNKNEHVSQ